MSTPQGTVHYLCLQATTEGQASYAHVHEVIAGLTQLGWSVELFEPSYTGQNGVPPIWKRVLEFLRIQVRMWASRKPKALYIRRHFAAFPSALWARLRGIPVIQEVNGPYEDVFIAWPQARKVHRMLIWLQKRQLLWADSIIVVTPQLRTWVKGEVGDKLVTIIPNGANIDLFSPEAKLTPIAQDLPKAFVVFFGALASWQGIATLLRAREDSAWPAEVEIVIMGDGAERAKVKASHNARRVRYLGVVPYKDVPAIVARSLAGISVKNNLGDRSSTGLSPLKVYETMACGVPVIVSDFPGVADLVRERSLGLVIPPDDSHELARAVAFLTQHQDLRREMGSRAREVVARDHSWLRRAQDTSEVLGALMRLKEVRNDAH